MPDKLTDSEIVKALELEVNKKSCIHEEYEEACGLWCKHYHKWCEDMSGKNKKDNCSAFKPNAPTKRAKATLDLINRLQAECDNLKDILYDAEGVNLVNYWHQQCKIAENGCRNYAEENKKLQAKNERLKKAIKNFKATKTRLRAENEELAYKLGCLLCHATGGKLSKHTYPLGYMECFVNDNIQDYCEEAEKEAKAEAYKEFAELLDKQFDIGVFNSCYIRGKIYDLLKELVGDKE